MEAGNGRFENELASGRVGGRVARSHPGGNRSF